MMMMMMMMMMTNMTVCRSSALTVTGSRRSTRRSPSLMRSVSISWRWTGTAEMQATPCGLQNVRAGPRTEESSVLQTVTTTTTLVQSAQGKADGGTESAVRMSSIKINAVTGRQRVRPKTCRPVACWWNSTDKPAGESTHRDTADIRNFCTSHMQTIL